LKFIKPQTPKNQTIRAFVVPKSPYPTKTIPKNPQAAPLAGTHLQRVPKSIAHKAYQSPQQPNPIIPQKSVS